MNYRIAFSVGVGILGLVAVFIGVRQLVSGSVTPPLKTERRMVVEKVGDNVGMGMVAMDTAEARRYDEQTAEKEKQREEEKRLTDSTNAALCEERGHISRINNPRVIQR